MAFITKQEFTSHIFEEAIATISRGDDSKLTDAINAALAQAKRSLTRYDSAAIFATVEDKSIYADLIIYIKDIAKWHFIAVCNVQVDLELAERRYKAAIAELDKIKKGELIEGWPVPEMPNTPNLRYGSNPKYFTERW